MVPTMLFSFALYIIFTVYLSVFVMRKIYKKYLRGKKRHIKILSIIGLEILIIISGLIAGAVLTFLFAILLGPLAVTPVVFIYFLTSIIVTIISIFRFLKKKDESRIN